jgi:hypothetical protein
MRGVVMARPNGCGGWELTDEDVAEIARASGWDDEAARLVQVIREAVSAHEEDGPAQWYVDEFTIDCDAERFWQVVEQAIRDQELGRTGMGELAIPEDVPGTPPEPPLTAVQAAALVAAVERIACQITGSSRDNPGMAFQRLGLTAAQAKTITSISAP